MELFARRKKHIGFFLKNVPDVACFRPLVCIGDSSGTHIIMLIVRVPRWEETNSLSTQGAFYSLFSTEICD
jgi:hypothetical protein